MYNVWIVDDEPFILDGLAGIVDWTSMGLSLAGQAEHGLDALEQIDEAQAQVDILITDIAMPEMDGLALLRELKRRCPELRAIVLSGYNEFDYIKEGMNIGIENYLLKPINLEELRETLIHTVEKLNRARIERLSRDQVGLLKDNILYRWIAGRIGREQWQLRSEFLGLRLAAPAVCAAIVRLADAGMPDRGALQQRIRERTEAFVRPLGLPHLCFQNTDDDTVLLIGAQGTSADELDGLMKRLEALATELGDVIARHEALDGEPGGPDARDDRAAGGARGAAGRADARDDGAAGDALGTAGRADARDDGATGDARGAAVRADVRDDGAAGGARGTAVRADARDDGAAGGASGAAVRADVRDDGAAGDARGTAGRADARTIAMPRAVIAAGSLEPGFEQAPDSYRHALLALEYALLYPTEPVLAYSRLAGLSGSDYAPAADADTYARLVLAHDMSRLSTQIEDDFDAFARLEGMKPEQLRHGALEMVMQLKKLLKDAPPGHPAYQSYHDAVNRILSSASLEQLKESVLGMAKAVSEALGEREETSPVVRQILKQIESACHKEYSLKTLAQEYRVHPVYLGQLFQKETGQTFSDYLNRLRIGRATELMLATPMKMQEIAEAVGYWDTAHFYKHFKKYVGVAPAQYRKQQ
ncbi:helix-turn-helix domain-containing protein [Cohnella sp. 56]|uniref:helix-turn-helix domain-containing protein n=1 Tax=Cohnella sp. 56 TaxID=3113722 RepID=UPI0030E9F0C5